MVLRNSPEPLTKVTLNLFAADVERLKARFPDRHSTYLRHLLRAHLRRQDAEVSAGAAELADEIDIDD